MNSIFIFCIKTIVCSGIFYGYYRLFLRDKKFHGYNRFYLLGSLLLSVLIPLIKIPVLYTAPGKTGGFVYETIQVITTNHWEDEGAALQQTGHNTPLANLAGDLYIVYLAGVLIGAWFLLRSLLYIYYLRAAWPYEKVQGLKLYSTKEKGTPFSFFRSIFWNDDLPFNSVAGQQVFRHELFHVQQKHSWDIFFAEIMTIVGWFNPFFYLAKKELKAVHEFMADEHAAKGRDSYAYAELLIHQVIAARNMPVTHYFFQTHIKRRIAMITERANQRTKLWSRVMILPIFALVFCSFAFYAQHAEPSSAIKLPAQPMTIVVDAGHGGIDPGAQATDQHVAEKDIALQLAKKVADLGPRYNVKVLLTRESDELPGSNNNIREALLYRTSFTEKANADAFISLHLAAADSERPGGVEVYIPSNDAPATKGSEELGASMIASMKKLYTVKNSLLRHQRNIWVLNHAPCPALLIECGFITNPDDVRFMVSHQEAVAQSILEGVIAFKNK